MVDNLNTASFPGCEEEAKAEGGNRSSDLGPWTSDFRSPST